MNRYMTLHRYTLHMYMYVCIYAYIYIYIYIYICIHTYTPILVRVVSALRSGGRRLSGERRRLEAILLIVIIAILLIELIAIIPNSNNSYPAIRSIVITASDYHRLEGEAHYISLSI